MAIYHCSVQTFSRSSGHSAVAAAAYRNGLKLLDDRTGLAHDYTKRKGVDFSESLGPLPDPKPNPEQTPAPRGKPGMKL